MYQKLVRATLNYTVILINYMKESNKMLPVTVKKRRNVKLWAIMCLV